MRQRLAVEDAKRSVQLAHEKRNRCWGYEYCLSFRLRPRRRGWVLLLRMAVPALLALWRKNEARAIGTVRKKTVFPRLRTVMEVELP